jgi:hypothetical protein
MKIKDKYKVKAIKKHECKEWFMYKHYAKRLPIMIYTYGLFEKNNLIGVCSYGNPISKDLVNNMLNGKYKKSIFELNRLVVNENLEKNTLSYFVSQTFKLLPSPCCLVSYADSSQGHHGYIYQSTNWIYTGLTQSIKDWKEIGTNKHSRTFSELGADYMRKHPDRYKQVEMSRKHRYIYFIGNKREKKDMKNNLKYEVEPYPKGNNKRYDASYKPSTQQQLF